MNMAIGVMVDDYGDSLLCACVCRFFSQELKWKDEGKNKESEFFEQIIVHFLFFFQTISFSPFFFSFFLID